MVIPGVENCVSDSDFIVHQHRLTVEGSVGVQFVEDVLVHDGLARLTSRAKDLGSQLRREEASKDSPATESATICFGEFSVVGARVFMVD